MKVLNFKAYLSLLLIIAVNFSYIKVGTIVLHFQLNKTFYAKELCVKKDIPMNNCQGNCILAQKLRAAEERNNPQVPLVLPPIKFELLFCQNPQSEIITSQTFNILIEHSTPYLKKDYATIYFDIFHPPQILS